MTPAPDPHELLRSGELTVLGRIRSASNATFLCQASIGGHAMHCVYKPVAGEQPLWDFPDGTLAGRELGAYLVSRRLGWNLVPDTVIRDGPAGEGMVQRWIDAPEETGAPARDLVDVVPAATVPDGYLPVLQARDYTGARVILVHADHPRLFQMAVFDVLVNNADRKGGHVLCGADGAVYGVDHGLTLHTEDKLRTVLWGWAGKPVDDTVLTDIAALTEALDGPLAAELAGHITGAEIAALRRRAEDLLAEPVMPDPDDRFHPIPWPAF
ncbi:SCO1664 family protein [Mycobacterium sp. 1274756.6]|uniref:SCO1664 family protein n=1 Tax=Mycobacterium sp. 1274756.6 TaxID=1834076 RepID=UPI00080103CD|nr:SCO1664 family protein [Mycobacterium sp. 1274756.6]OBJ73573.1 phosphatidylinositol kinase [Mycobacterium sp. 1274756.6]